MHCKLCLDEDVPVVYVNGEEFKYCEDCIKEFIATQFQRYVFSLIKASCEPDYKKLLELGPPTYFRDITEEVKEYTVNGVTHSAKLACSLDEDNMGRFKERLKYIYERMYTISYMDETKQVLFEFGLLS